MVTAQEIVTAHEAFEAEVACAAHHMGYELIRCPDGYVLARQVGNESQIVTAPTLEEITEHLKH
jgi:hypothetical protein